MHCLAVISHKMALSVDSRCGTESLAPMPHVQANIHTKSSLSDSLSADSTPAFLQEVLLHISGMRFLKALCNNP